VGETTNPADPVNLNHAHAMLMRPDPLSRKFAGALRDQQNWIGGSDHTPRGASFVPPEPGRVGALMSDLHHFCERKDLPALAQAAIAHAQFETIHPYADGNGRLGRALLNAVLRYRRVTTAAIVPIASAFMASRETYFALLGAYREGDADLFVNYIARCALSACRVASESATTLAQLPEQWRASAQPRSGSAALKLIDSLLGQPLLTAELAAERADCTRQAAYNAIAKLEEAGVLRNVGRGPRAQAWAAGDVLEMCWMRRRPSLSGSMRLAGNSLAPVPAPISGGCRQRQIHQCTVNGSFPVFQGRRAWTCLSPGKPAARDWTCRGEAKP
jgi:Fic family protein